MPKGKKSAKGLKKSPRNMTPEEVGKLSKPEMIKALRQLRQQYEKKIATLNKQDVYSPAAKKMESYYDELGKQPMSKISRNRAMGEVFRLQEFFNSKTSTVTGAKEVMREQDARIYGVNKAGRVRHRMTNEERDRFWSVYTEFLNQKKTAYVEFTSGKIQQYLGDILLKTKKSYDEINYEELYQDLRSRNIADNGGYGDAGNVYTGVQGGRSK